MNDSFKITESEWEVMKIIWKNNPITSDEIIEKLSADKEWAHQTVRTFINRLLKKEIIHYKRSGRNYLYYPLVSEKQCIQAENKSYLERVYSGAVGLLFANFIEDEQLSDKEIEALQELLEEKKKEQSKL